MRHKVYGIGNTRQWGDIQKDGWMGDGDSMSVSQDGGGYGVGDRRELGKWVIYPQFTLQSSLIWVEHETDKERLKFNMQWRG